MAAGKLRLVAAITRTFVWMDRVPPTRSNSCSCKTRSKFLASSGLPGDQHGDVCGSNLRHKKKYFLQGARTPDDLVAHRSLIDFFGQGDALVFEFLFGLLWIRDDFCPASHELLASPI